jgi:phosphoadenosine phosphosulfate reductase
MSKEPRPVYAAEMDILGFDKYWNYDKQNDTPYMWAEANRYLYRGRLVAALKGGNIYTAPDIQLAFVCAEFRETPNGKTTEKILLEIADKCPTFIQEKGNRGAKDYVTNTFTVVEPEPNGGGLRPIDIAAMVEANHEILGWVADTTAKKILAVYEKYVDKLDIFHIAFSGGKDSCVLLDLVKKTLPKKSFVVVFGDTGMEFPDTYDVVDKTEEMCRREDIPFYRAHSHFSPEESWELFGPPSRALRWCCSVHKSTPQALLLREVIKKADNKVLTFLGVRAEESITRSKYKYENYGKKQKGQFSHNSILEWTSAEVWLYVYANSILINEAYKKGNSRAGCLVCPMSSGTGDFFRRQSYTAEIEGFVDIIKRMNNWDEKKDIKTYIANGGWDNRRSGRGLDGNFARYYETCEDGIITIELMEPLSDWREWIKTIDNCAVDYKVRKTKTGLVVTVWEQYLKDNPSFGKLFKQVFRKAAYCVGCRVCESNCRNRRLKFENRKPNIKDCEHCFECHDLPGGCLAYNALKIPKGEKKMRSINCFDDHAPKSTWFGAFFSDKQGYFASHGLGPNQITHFKRYLRDAKLITDNAFSDFAELISQIGWDTDTAQGLILVNLVVENAQFEWYVQCLDVGRAYTQKEAVDTLLSLDLKEKGAKSVIKSFKRLTETPLGTKLNFGYVADNGNLIRTKCHVSDPRVILYALYVYNEKANAHFEFRLNSLYENVKQDGIPPTRIFGLSREEMIPLLLGLTANYPDFINATFTNDLDKISLKEDKTSGDVLSLFREGN